MHKQKVAIDFGTSFMKLVVGQAVQDGNIEIKEAYKVKTPKGAISDGKIMDIKQVKNILFDVLKDIEKVKEGTCTIQSTETITREMVLPVFKPQDMNQMIEMEIYQSFPIDLEDYIVEHKVTHEFMEDHIKKATIMAAALPKKIVDDYLQLLAELKLKPIAIDIHSNAISKLFAEDRNNKINEIHETRDKTIVLLDMGYHQINLHIISNGILKVSRILLKDLITDHEYLFAEINRYFQFYTSKKTDNRIDAIFLYGGDTDEAFKLALSEATAIPAFQISKISNIMHDEQLEIGDYMNAIGALIRK